MKKLTLLHWWQLETDDGIFVRLGPNNWSKRIGSYMLHVEESTELERQFLIHSREQMKELERS